MKSIVQFSKLGKYGRFGNQLFQYAFARAFAEKHGAVLEIPHEWIGRKIFKDIYHPCISRRLPQTKMDEIPKEANVDLFGFYQNEESLDFLNISKLKEWLKIKEDLLEHFNKPKSYYVACHLRRGDYVKKYSNCFCIVEKESYINHLNKINIDMNDVVWVSEDTPNVNNTYSDISFLEDFLILLNSDMLIRSNSTFSYWAGILGGMTVHSPIVEDRIGYNVVDFADNNWERLFDKKHHKDFIGKYDDIFIKE